MSLSYTTYETKRTWDRGVLVREVRERVTREVTAPSHWSCYGSKGNYALKKKAERLIAKVEKIVAEKDVWEQRKAIKAALVSFIASWERMGSSATYRDEGISDTAVRECVGSFHDKIVAATYGGGHCDYDEWKRHHDEAYRRVSKSRGY